MEQEDSPYHKPFLDTFSMYERTCLWVEQVLEHQLQKIEHRLEIGCIACPPPMTKRFPEDATKIGIGWQMFACFDGNYGRIQFWAALILLTWANGSSSLLHSLVVRDI